MGVAMFQYFLFIQFSDHPDLHVLAHYFPTRRSSDLLVAPQGISVRINAELRNAAGRAKVRADRCSVDRQRDIVETADADHRVNLDIQVQRDRKSTRLKLQSLMRISSAVLCLQQKTTSEHNHRRQDNIITKTKT